jgi:hypothetical protein
MVLPTRITKLHTTPGDTWFEDHGRQRPEKTIFSGNAPCRRGFFLGKRRGGKTMGVIVWKTRRGLGFSSAKQGNKGSLLD